MEYLGEILWYLSLPIMVWTATYFVRWNLKAFDDIVSTEKSEALKK